MWLMPHSGAKSVDRPPEDVPMNLGITIARLLLGIYTSSKSSYLSLLITHYLSRLTFTRQRRCSTR